jgi:hypothetical protein
VALLRGLQGTQRTDGKDKFLIPVVKELLDELRDTCFFSKIDLRSSYHQVLLHAADVAKITFRTHEALFKFLSVPFSLTNASTTFQALMNNMLRRFILVFFDDILVYSHSWSEHLQHVRIILTTLKEHQLFMKRAKCVFGRTEVSYLGHVISTTGVAMDQLKVQAVLDWPVPTTVRVVRVLGAGRLLPLVHP